MDQFNTSVFILSTHSVSSGIQLGVILTLDEIEKTILCGLELLQSVIPKNAFFGKGPASGPDAVMIDDSTAEYPSPSTIQKRIQMNDYTG